MTEKKRNSFLILVIFIPLSLLVGVAVGWFSQRIKSTYSTYSPLEEAMELINQYYVDSVDMRGISRSLIPSLLHSLDPHSEYMDKEVSLAETQRLEGHFYGVGISFNTIIDTPVVVDVIKGGGAERAGILPGDRILTADNVSLLSDTLNNDQIQKSLKGKKGSIVKVGILRDGHPLSVGITRDDVPLSSINVSYMLDDQVGLIKINDWGRTTHQEFIAHYAKLKEKGLKKLVIDLRDNVGGYMQSAIQLANEFLNEGDMIVYSQGRNYPKEEYIANGTGLFKDIPLAILVNELSASSSEIFSGSLQDNDRASIVGRRTFGKGLIQQPFYLPDSSQIRLTVARYYMPSGRSIQKKYTLGNQADYQKDILNRIDDGEMFRIDSSLYKDAPKYKTKAGRIVYGEVGIIPDIFVPVDSSGTNSYYIRLINSGLMPEFAFRFVDKYRHAFLEQNSPTALWDYLRNNYTLVEEFANFASMRGISKRPAMMRDCYSLLDKVLSAQVSQFIFGERGFYEVYFSDDSTIEVARKALYQPSIKKR